MPFRSNWRDCQAWRDEGLPWSTTSNEAVKLYDAALTQVLGYYEDPVIGGLTKTFENMREADPNFVMGHVFETALSLTGTDLPNPYLNPDEREKIDNILTLAKSQKLTDLEQKHVEAFRILGEGRKLEASKVYEDILLDHPQDMTAARLVFFNHLFTGQHPEMRDSLARVIPRCKSSMPLYSYLLGMWGFACVENNMFAVGEKLSRQGLEMNEHDAWATHAIAHALEHTCRPEEGVTFLNTTRGNWELGSHLAGHNNWHLAVFHIEKGNFESALDVYDEKIAMKNPAIYDINDLASLLRRLELRGVDVGGRWADVYEGGRPFLGPHGGIFNNLHSFLSCVGSKHIAEAKQYVKDLQEVITKLPSHDYYRQTAEEVGVPLYKALVAYEEGDFAAAVNLLRPLKYKTAQIGGSNAQRDIIDLILIDAALQSPDPHHAQLSKALLYERKALREKSSMTEAMMARIMAKHDQD